MLRRKMYETGRKYLRPFRYFHVKTKKQMKWKCRDYSVKGRNKTPTRLLTFLLIVFSSKVDNRIDQLLVAHLIPDCWSEDTRGGSIMTNDDSQIPWKCLTGRKWAWINDVTRPLPFRTFLRPAAQVSALKKITITTIKVFMSGGRRQRLFTLSDTCFWAFMCVFVDFSNAGRPVFTQEAGVDDRTLCVSLSDSNVFYDTWR